ncbi:MAG: hypothetical protein ACREX6_02815, partial [Casimicrobiaceae bacterium]
SPRPSGATRQILTFTLDTGTLFDSGTNIDHIPIFLRFHAELGSDGFPGLPYDGLGIFFSLPQWNGNFCRSTATAGAQIFVERAANANRLTATLPTGAFVDCAANLPQPLASNHSYSIAVTVTDDAKLGYTVTDLANGGLVASYALHDYSSWYPCPLVPDAGNLSTANAYCANPMSPDRFSNFRTGYLVWPLFTAQASGAEGAIRDVTLQWLP